ncbi:MAG: acetylornithine carbamoyltransferase [Balneola sp.]|jgi:N-succinyl-L-ornithine transcarbamylase|nr:acetylornithine carbamoyltransferase [Balneola sp.]MBE78030.1 acetylornithine carbamoyltransferase [Balneola sp.]|tara:strand:- start:6941 stop:7891 length:951 start_codon:yes stop_codon:yes gene_type:complete
MKSFLSIKDVRDLPKLVKVALEIKKNPHVYKDLGQNKSMCLIFLNPSLRTRLSSQKAAFNLGLNTAVLDVGSQGWQLEFADGVVMDSNKAEHIKEAAAVIGSYFDVVAIRAFAKLEDREEDYSEQVMEAFKTYCPAPVINMESGTGHPLQALADLITIEEHKSVDKPKVVLTWAPHPRALPQAVANSFSRWMQAADFDLTITHPEGYELVDEAVGNAKVDYDQNKAFEGADFVYAKNWSSYSSYGKILSTDPEWMVSKKKMGLTNNAKFMHCLPVRRNVIVEDAVIDSENSLVIPEATNRIYSMQVVLQHILEGLK